MLTMIDNLLGTPVMSLQTGTQLASTSSVIVDPRQLVVSAFYVEGPQMARKQTVIHPADIREISDIGLIVDSDAKLMQLDDLVRLQQVIDFRFELKGLKVVDEDGRKHGKVSSYAIDPETFTVQQLYTTESLLRSFSSVGKIIHRNQIVSVDNERVTIKSTKTKVTEVEKTPQQHAFVNPFRKTEQPEG